MSAQKKGLPALAWVAIGCGGVFLVVMLGLGILTFVGLKKGQEFLEEAEKNPEIAVARAIAWANPEIDMVSADEENKTVTFKNKETGEEFVVDFKDLEEGRVSFSSDSGSMVIDADASGGGTTITTDGGTARFGEGLGNMDLPDWLPVFEGAGVQGSMISNTDGLHSGLFTLVVPEGKADELYEFYKDHMAELGLTITESTFTIDNHVSRILNARNDDDSQSLVLTLNQSPEGETAAIQFTQSN